MLKITSRENSGVKLLAKLLSSSRERRQSGLFVLEGLRLVTDAVKSGAVVETLYLTEEMHAALQAEPWLAACKQVYLIDRELLQRVSDTKTSQGIAAVFRQKQEAAVLPQDFSRGALLLCSLQDPGNVGTILRTAEAMGLCCVILTADCPEATSPKVLRASMGAALRLPIITFPTSADAIASLRERGVLVCAAALSAESISIDKVDLKGACIAIGNEGNGLSEQEIALCDCSVIIPIAAESESLNAAMAATIFAWELKKAVTA